MCGIAGIFSPSDEKVIRRMTKAILHRGPDEDGFFEDGHVSLGMRRLSIIDVEGGHQPIHSADGRFVLVFNGEIYNYRELKEKFLKDKKLKTESDTEVVLSMYELLGEKCVTRLRGMFAFAIYDTEKKTVFIARDYFGIKPLYYLMEDNKVKAFASEIKSFYGYKNFKASVNDTAVFNYLSYQYNPLEETFFEDVYKLLPGHCITINAETGVGSIKRYWYYEISPNTKLDEDATREKIARVMKDSVEHHMIADVPVGSFLSGGIDSSIIATLMQRIRGESKVKTFTISFGSVSEGTEAKETALPLGTDHTEISVGSQEYFEALPEVMWHFDEPVADPSALGLFFLAKEARKHVKVVLSGEGADELFGGYNIYLEPFSRKKIAWIPRPVLQFVAKLPFRGSNYARRALERLEDRYIGNATVFGVTEAEKLWKGKDVETNSLAPLYRESKGLSDSSKMQYVDVHTWLVGDILAKADKMTMAHSLELRVPFLDIEVAELARILPDKFKWNGRTTKYLLREAFKNVLPESTRTRRKLGFPTPIREWFTEERQDIYKTILENQYIKEKLDTRYIETIIADHVNNRADNSRKIYLLLALAIWYNNFIDIKGE